MEYNMLFRYKQHVYIGMSCPSWQWHRAGSRWFPVRTLPVAPLWCDLGFVPNSRGNKAAANLRPKIMIPAHGLRNGNHDKPFHVDKPVHLGDLNAVLLVQ